MQPLTLFNTNRFMNTKNNILKLMGIMKIFITFFFLIIGLQPDLIKEELILF